MPFRAHPSGIIGGSMAADDFVTTTNDFVTVKDFGVEVLDTKTFYVEAGGNDLGFRVLGSYDGGLTYPVTAQGSVTVSTAAGSAFPITDYYTNLRAQVVPATDGQHGTASVVLAGASF